MIEQPDGFLKGRELIDNIRRLEEAAQQAALQLDAKGQLGVRGPEMLTRLGDGLSLLAQIASCAWGCRHAGHAVENLVRRLANAATAALRLAYLGYYDEAIGVIRSAGELANLLQLFFLAPVELGTWTASSRSERMSRYGPAAVRRLVEARDERPIVDEPAYRVLCELGIHVTPASAFLSHDLEGARVYVGPQLSIPGLFLVVSELTYLVGSVLPLVGRLTQQAEPRLGELKACQGALLGTLTWLRITNYEQVLKDFREKFDDNGI
ncbi:MAG: hypothetical protein O2845_02265 [Proteobacteria bacterium]|nr:hypothetical protein [Pseudomonadota bacterium]